MAITIFKDKECKGASQVVSANLRDLKNMPADKPGSIRMTDGRDAVVMFKNDDWHGGALYLNGKQTITNLGSSKEGGRFGFGNSIRSIRVTPFTMDLNISVVTNGSDLPGIWPSTWWAEGVLRDVVARANNYLLAQNALLQMSIARITFRDNPKHFNLTGVESWSFPSSWKNKHELDVIIIDKFDKDGTAGKTKMPCFGKTLTVAARATLAGVDTNLVNEFMAITLVHELGHYLGLGHGTADNNPNNIMFNAGSPTALLSDFSLWKDQVREMQDRLANNLARKGDRNE